MNLNTASALRTRRASTVFARGVLLATVLGLALGPAAAYAEDTADGQVTITVPTAEPLPVTPPVTTPSGTTPDTTTETDVTRTLVTTGGNTLPETTAVGTTGGTSTSPQDAPAPTEPAIPRQPAAKGDGAKVDRETYQAGAWAVVTAAGFTPGEQVQVVLYSDPQLIGNVAAKADGTFEHRFAIPDDLAAGRHTVQLTGWASKHIATADLFVATGPLAADASVPVIPDGIWWAAGVLAVLLLLAAFWWVIRVMRAPAAKLGAV